ncbi:Rap1a/Tai family immunity protein [Chitinimonas sp. JJ19]|uniref:Rap1a/Tai family immunity protein n=1 Tax=Chitinimonas sp. JJ19 TaxID=3109352 RepID=UPI0030012D14
MNRMILRTAAGLVLAWLALPLSAAPATTPAATTPPAAPASKTAKPAKAVEAKKADVNKVDAKKLDAKKADKAEAKKAEAKSKPGSTAYNRYAPIGTFRVSVARLLDFADGNGMTPPPDGPSTTTIRLAKDQADIYLSGVLDSGEGVNWCTGRPGVATAEVHAEIVRSLRRIKQRDSSAAAAVGNVAKERFPCKRTT